TPGTFQNIRSTPQKHPIATYSTSTPSPHGPCSGVPSTSWVSGMPGSGWSRPSRGRPVILIWCSRIPPVSHHSASAVCRPPTPCGGPTRGCGTVPCMTSSSSAAWLVVAAGGAGSGEPTGTDLLVRVGLPLLLVLIGLGLWLWGRRERAEARAEIGVKGGFGGPPGTTDI